MSSQPFPPPFRYIVDGEESRSGLLGRHEREASTDPSFCRTMDSLLRRRKLKKAAALWDKESEVVGFLPSWSKMERLGLDPFIALGCYRGRGKREVISQEALGGAATAMIDYLRGVGAKIDITNNDDNNTSVLNIKLLATVYGIKYYVRDAAELFRFFYGQLRECANCGKSEKECDLQLCARCRKVRYCCQDCHREHWRSTHKHECVKRAEGV